MPASAASDPGSQASAASAAGAPPPLDEVMLAMDVVDTLRHRRRIVEDALNADARERALIGRLREIYAAQGIAVPDRILREGVKALEENRFAYEPPTDGFAVRLARAYVARDRWLKPALGAIAALVLALAAYQILVAAPREARLARAEIALNETIPAALIAARDAAVEIAATPELAARAEAIYGDGAAAVAARDLAAANAMLEALRLFEADLRAEYVIRIVSRPGARSGVFRTPENNPAQRNYYLIVEAVDGNGDPVEVNITSEEDQTTRRVRRWGLRVPQAEYERVAADKQDDNIIQNTEIGRKRRGFLNPEFVIETSGGAILEW